MLIVVEILDCLRFTAKLANSLNFLVILGLEIKIYTHPMLYKLYSAAMPH